MNPNSNKTPTTDSGRRTRRSLDFDDTAPGPDDGLLDSMCTMAAGEDLVANAFDLSTQEDLIKLPEWKL